MAGMNICKNCGVELEAEMKRCPLCGTFVEGEAESNFSSAYPAQAGTIFSKEKQQKHSLQKVLWQVSAIILFSGMITTLIIDTIINKRITWSVFPVSISLIVLCYVSLFAFWHTRIVFQLFAGWLIASALLWMLDVLVTPIPWATRLGMPLLFAVNLISIGLIGIIGITKQRGLNLIAYAFVAIALLCMSIEGIISFYRNNSIVLEWSIIVAACLLPVIAALLFMYFRTRKNAHLQKVFHT